MNCYLYMSQIFLLHKTVLFNYLVTWTNIFRLYGYWDAHLLHIALSNIENTSDIYDLLQIIYFRGKSVIRLLNKRISLIGIPVKTFIEISFFSSALTWFNSHFVTKCHDLMSGNIVTEIQETFIFDHISVKFVSFVYVWSTRLVMKVTFMVAMVIWQLHDGIWLASMSHQIWWPRVCAVVLTSSLTLVGQSVIGV